MKNIKMTERFSAQFHLEMFNAFNHVSFDSVDNDVNDGTYGQLNGNHLPRNIQLGLKLYF